MKGIPLTVRGYFSRMIYAVCLLIGILGLVEGAIPLGAQPSFRVQTLAGSNNAGDGDRHPKPSSSKPKGRDRRRRHPLYRRRRETTEYAPLLRMALSAPSPVTVLRAPAETMDQPKMPVSIALTGCP